jgi:CubicO group peptidase (beta-lactamase class C family)
MPNVHQSADSFLLSRRMVLAGTIAGVAAPALAVKTPGDAIDLFLSAQLQSGAIPGMAVGVARAGRITLTRAYGFANIADQRRVTVDTMFHLASVTKTVTATAVMMLVEAGKIELDAPANRYLDFEVINPNHPGGVITVRHLMMHVSGISDETYYKVDFLTPGRDSPLALRVFLKDYLVPGEKYYTATANFSAAAPGSAYAYSNVGYGLLGYLAECVTGEDLRVFTQRRMFAPLGMHPVSWTIAGVPPSLMATPYDSADGRVVAIKPVGFPDFPAGMLRASVAGFMPFLAASANGGATATTRMLSATAQAEMLAMHVPPGLPTWLTGQGLGWMESNEMGKRRVNHWGGDPGVFTAVYLEPASTTGVAIFTNVTATPASRAALKAIAARLLTESL